MFFFVKKNAGSMNASQNNIVPLTAVKSTQYSVNNEASFCDGTHKQRL
jgi:hypothetical protein